MKDCAYFMHISGSSVIGVFGTVGLHIRIECLTYEIGLRRIVMVWILMPYVKGVFGSWFISLVAFCLT